MIILTLGGGLGNQMFQYAFVRKLQELTGDYELKFSGYHLKDTVNSERMLFNLNIQPGITFCDGAEEQRLEEYQEKQLKKLHYYKVLSRYLKGAASFKLKQYSKKGFYTSHLAYDKQEYAVADIEVKYVEGAFQTWRYWEDMFPAIREELMVKTEPSPENAAMIKEMQGCESVCVHIRRGDYLAPQFAHLNVCGEAYYQMAMAELAAKKPDAVFYIFTNDHKEVEWIRENYRLERYSVRFVDLNNPDYEELRLMYSCKNFIISNSTFSWWGQFLCGNPDKTVMAPGVWNREMRADGIYMPGWDIIKVD